MRCSLMVVLALVVSTTALAQKKKMVCWTDDAGVRACGDSVPPQFAKKERAILNERGVVVDTKAREKTTADLADDERKSRAALEAQKQAEYDGYLLQSFQTVTDLEAARDERLNTLKGRLRLAEKSLAGSEAGVKTLNEGVEATRKAGREPDAKQLQQLKDYQSGLTDNRRAVAGLTVERQQVAAKFERDIARYRQLRGLPAEVALSDAQMLIEAKEFFARYAELARAFDPRVGDFYATGAVISMRRLTPGGGIQERELSGRDYRQQVRAAMPVAQERKDVNTYSEVTYTLEDRRVRIAGMRFAELRKHSSPFSMLAGVNSDGEWRIYEERVEIKQ